MRFKGILLLAAISLICAPVANAQVVSGGASRAAVTSGTINGATIGATTPSTIRGTTITATTGNFVVGTSGSGVSFAAASTASPPGTGAVTTASLLAKYDEGTWTPIDASGAGIAFTNTSGNCFWTRSGRTVTISYMITFGANASGVSALVGQLPFPAKSTTNDIQGGIVTFSDYVTTVPLLVRTQHGASTFVINGAGYVGLTNANLTGKTIRGNFTYQTD